MTLSINVLTYVDILFEKVLKPNTNDLYIWVPSFHTLQNCYNRGGDTMFKYMNYVSIFVVTVWMCFFSSKEGVPVLLSI